ncbi:MAG: SPOR domain-containing protein [Tenacibaculum sp.]
MTLANYINDLLYRYDCVIVPNFGGFVTNKIGAKVNNFTHTFYPPKKQVTFNSYLQHNDGLLANYIASNKSISFEEATAFIATEVAVWKQELVTTPVKVALVGSLSLNEAKQVIFEPNTSNNFLTASFGLSTVKSDAIKRLNKEVKVLPIVTEEKENNAPIFLKRAIAAAFIVGIGYMSWNSIQNNQQKELQANQAAEVQKKIQSATFVIDNPLPTINLNTSKESTGNFHIIAGAFQEVENAENKLAALKELGYDARIIGENDYGLTQVAYQSFSSKEAARKALIILQEQVNEDAWLLIK